MLSDYDKDHQLNESHKDTQASHFDDDARES